MAPFENSTVGSSDSCVNWTACELVETVTGKVSGRPIVRGTRILADTIVQDAELGSSVEEIRENYPDLPVEAIESLITFGVRVRLDHKLPS